VERRTQVLEPARADRDLVEQDRREDDPHDREEAERGALGGREDGEVERHPEEHGGHDDGHGHRRQAGPVGLPPQDTEREEHGDQGEQGHEGRDRQAVRHR
jgi:hypothetical protein